MKKILLLIKSSIKSNFKSGALVGVYLGIALICTVVIGLIGIKSFINPAIEGGVTDRQSLNIVISFLGYCTMMLVSGISYSILFSVPLIREKTCGNIESLLATPTSPIKLWISKTLGLYIPGLITGIIFSVGMITFLNKICLERGVIYKPISSIMLCTYVILPIVYLALSMLMNLVGLIGRVPDAAVIGIIFVSGVITVMINLVARGNIAAESVTFLIINLAIAIVLVGLTIIFSDKLTTERIILSCRK